MVERYRSSGEAQQHLNSSGKSDRAPRACCRMCRHIQQRIQYAHVFLLSMYASIATSLYVILYSICRRYMIYMNTVATRYRYLHIYISVAGLYRPARLCSYHLRPTEY